MAIAVGASYRIWHRVRSGPIGCLRLGYGELAAAILVIGSIRQQRGEAALHRGDYHQLLAPLVTWVTVAAVALTTVTLILLAIGTYSSIKPSSTCHE